MRKIKRVNRKMSKHDRELLAAADPKIVHGIEECVRIYNEMSDAALSAEPTIGGAIAILQAVSKVIAHYKRAMQKLGIDVDQNLHDCVALWEKRMDDGKDMMEQENFDRLADDIAAHETAKALLVNVRF